MRALPLSVFIGFYNTHTALEQEQESLLPGEVTAWSLEPWLLKSLPVVEQLPWDGW